MKSSQVDAGKLLFAEETDSEAQASDPSEAYIETSMAIVDGEVVRLAIEDKSKRAFDISFEST